MAVINTGIIIITLACTGSAGAGFSLNCMKFATPRSSGKMK
jgi:hypothetical protein